MTKKDFEAIALPFAYKAKIKKNVMRMTHHRSADYELHKRDLRTLRNIALDLANHLEIYQGFDKAKFLKSCDLYEAVQ